MKFLLLCTAADETYLERFQRLPALAGHQLVKATRVYENPVTLDRVCDAHGIDGVFCAQAEMIAPILHDQTDYQSPVKEKKLTLDDYAGSLLRLRSGREVVILNPLERLRTVSEESFVVDRYSRKLTKPDSFFVQTPFKWSLVTLDNRDAVLAAIKAARLCAIDIETPWPQDSIRSMRCVSYTCYFPETHTTASYVIPFEEPWHQQFIRDANATETAKVLQNGLFDNTYFLRWGAPLTNWYHDTFHLFHSWLSELPKRLDFITSFVLRDIRYWKQEGKTGNKEDLYRYCARDGWATVNSLLALLSEIPRWAFVNYTEHEFPMVFPSLHAGAEGIPCDVERFKRIAQEKKDEVEQQLERLRYLVASPLYNPGSAKQNTNLFRLLGCADLVKDPKLSERENARRGTGKIQTAKAAARHPLNALILEMVEAYKKEKKQVDTYFNPDKLWNERIYYALNPGGTDTLRAASSESAFDCGWQIQNIPRDDDSFKQCCIAPPGWFIGEADKAQSEARCVGYLSGEEALIELVESSHDYHSWNAAAFFGIPYEEIFDEANHKQLNKPLRDLAKRTNHGANYNMGKSVMLDTMGPKRVASAKITLKLPSYLKLVDVCQFLLERYERTYPAVKGRWYASIISAIERTGMLVSAFGWTRRFFGNPRGNKQDLNSAVAHAPQNLSVAVVNREWYRVWRESVYGSLRGRVRVLAQIHDSILFLYRTRTDAEAVHALMDTRVVVTGSDGINREMFIPSDLSAPDKSRWSEIK
jgi:DNA polymerase I-like protein with 3'-5' exonuclease and polymerase domains